MMLSGKVLISFFYTYLVGCSLIDLEGVVDQPGIIYININLKKWLKRKLCIEIPEPGSLRLRNMQRSIPEPLKKKK
jgi:hypothetical protein